MGTTGAERALTYTPAMAEAHNYIRWILSRFEGYLHGRILEVGLGHASFYPELARRGSYVGVDIDPDAVTEAGRRFPGAEFVEGDITSPTLASRLGAPPDAVVCVNVLEHLEDDAAAVRHLLGALRPGGHLLIGVPAFPALYNDLDRLAGHRRRYRTEAVRALVPPEIGEIVRLEYFNPIGGLGWWANNFVRHERLDGASISTQLRTFDRFVVPISRWLDPLTRGVFGQSVIGVVRRRPA